MSTTYQSPDGIAAARVLIPGRARKALYAAASLAGYALSAVAVGLIAGDLPIPDWVTVSLAVLGVLSGPLGQLAASNVATAPAAALVDQTSEEDGA